MVKLPLILLVAFAIVERTFSATKIVKNRLRNGMGDNLMNNCLITYIERDVFDSINIEAIIHGFKI